MKTGKSIVELAQEVQRQSDVKQDYLVDTRELKLVNDEGDIKLESPVSDGKITTTPSHHAHNQIAERIKVPSRYYHRMREEAPDLLIENVGHWFNSNPERRMIRTLDGNTRAFLSDKYRRIDNDAIASASLEALLNNSTQFDVISSEVTDSRLYIQARLPKVEGEVKLNDPVQAGVIITNSEVGGGALDIRPMIYRLVCLNGMVTGQVAESGRLRRSHIGSRQVAENYEVYTDETREADDKVLMMKIRDSITALSDPALFFELMRQMKEATEGPVIDNPIKAVEELGKVFTFKQDEHDNILENLIRDADYSRWGMLNAVTKSANEHESYDRAIELEEAGGRILGMTPSLWSQIAAA